MITTEAKRGQAVIRIEDTGIGIGKEMLTQIFELFAQSPDAMSRSEGGLGIGLTLVRMLVELHGGEITAASEGLGRGSTFTVRLPLAAALDADVSTRRIDAKDDGRSLRVLLVDDNADAAHALGALLRCLGHDVEIIGDGETAVEAAQRLKLDVALIDIGLPGIDGHEVARRLRRQQTTKSLRLVALTGYGTADAKLRSDRAGFDDHVVKPLDMDALERVLGARTSARRASSS